jgi:hypothetical protein
MVILVYQVLIYSYYYFMEHCSLLALSSPELEGVPVCPGAQCRRHSAMAEEDTWSGK